MEPDYLPKLIALMRANGFDEADIVDVTSRLVGTHPADLVVQREVVATAAMAGLLACAILPPDVAARNAVKYADALIAELAK